MVSACNIRRGPGHSCVTRCGAVGPVGYVTCNLFSGGVAGGIGEGRQGKGCFSGAPSLDYREKDSFNLSGNDVGDHIGEVIESSTRVWLVEVYRDAAVPAFGSWVYVRGDDGMVRYGVVSHVEIGSVEPNRRAVAFGKTPEKLRRELPQVLELLRMTCRVQVLAYREAGGALRQTLPPLPAGIHSFVDACPPDVVQALGAPFDFLRTLLRNPDPAVPVDDLVVALLRQRYLAFEAGIDGQAELIAAGRALSRLLDDDHERLQSILRRVV